MLGANYAKDKEIATVLSEMLLGCLQRVWAKLWLRRYVYTIALLVSLAIVPAPAYAQGYQKGLAGVIVGPSQWYDYGDPSDGGYIGYFVYASSVYDAAIYTLEPDAVDKLTQEQRAKLSNASTGGAFYDYATSFQTFTSGNEPHAWLSRDFYGQWVTMYGNDYLFWVEATKDEIADAKEDLQTVLSGGDLGGGGGGNVEGDGDYYKFDVFHVGTNINPVNDIKHIYLVKDYAPNMDIIDFENDNIYFAMSFDVYGTTLACYSTYFSVFDVLPSINTVQNDRYIEFSINNGKRAWLSASSNYQMPSQYEIIGNDIYFKEHVYANLIFRDAPQTDLVNNTNSVIAKYAGVVNNWPTEPTPTPKEPPEVPTPPEPTEPVQPVQPTEPTTPTLPPIIEPTEPTYDTPDLSAILDALNEHCVHLQHAIYDSVDGLWSALGQKLTDEGYATRLTVVQQVGWLGSVIGGYFTDLSSYLQDLFDWLADTFDFSFTAPSYDDGSLISWLKKIYAKLGTGQVNTRPVDPVANPKGVGDWLGQLLSNFIAALLGIGAGAIGGVAQQFQQLTTRFPFCIPWDIAAMIAIMVATPEPPIYDVPIMCLTSSGLQQVGQWHIDCSPFDPYMGGIRTMETVAFAFALCFKTDFFKQAVGVVSGKGK